MFICVFVRRSARLGRQRRWYGTAALCCPRWPRGAPCGFFDRKTSDINPRAKCHARFVESRCLPFQTMVTVHFMHSRQSLAIVRFRRESGAWQVPWFHPLGLCANFALACLLPCHMWGGHSPCIATTGTGRLSFAGMPSEPVLETPIFNR